MRDKQRRVRTGCLTCRARRVKCDEQAPECRRCVAANVTCAGYEQRRVVIPAKNQHLGQQRQQRYEGERSLEHQEQQEHQQEIYSSPSPTSSALPPRSLMSENAISTASISSPSFRLQTARQESANATTATKSQSPLVAFPSNPHRSQCPSLGARHVLGYSQVHLRTLSILFAPECRPFWQIDILQEAWGCEYLYLTLVALGNIHRAALMTASEDEGDQANGLDLKITAVQLYIQALEGLAMNLDEAKQTPVFLVAALCLMAYFESFSGNTPAFIGRIQAAGHYFTTLLPADKGPGGDDMWRNTNLAPLRDCLRSLVQTCYVTLPLKLIHATTKHHLDAFYLKTVNHPTCDSMTALTALNRLVDLISEDHEMEELIWSPIAPYGRKTTAQTMYDFEKRLEQWQTTHLHLIPELDSDSALNALLVYRWSTFTMPPPPYTSTTRCKSLAAAHYNFYKARIRWALLLLGEDEQQNKLTADFYFYEALRHAASHISFLTAAAGGDGDEEDSHYIPCEALRVGLLPVLHIAGLCSPEPRWLEWIKDLSDKIVQEGVLKGHTFATNLACLHTFETNRHRRRHRHRRRSGRDYPSSSLPISSVLEKYPEPAERIICQLIPEADGRHFTSFFATPEFSSEVGNGGGAIHDDWDHNGLNAYRVIGDARWRCGYGEGPCTPIYNMYDDDGSGDNDNAMLQPFSVDWLYSTQPALKWLSWSQEKEFCMERALEDHISGTRLLLAS